MNPRRQRHYEGWVVRCGKGLVPFRAQGCPCQPRADPNPSARLAQANPARGSASADSTYRRCNGGRRPAAYPGSWRAWYSKFVNNPLDKPLEIDGVVWPATTIGSRYPRVVAPPSSRHRARLKSPDDVRHPGIQQHVRAGSLRPRSRSTRFELMQP